MKKPDKLILWEGLESVNTEFVDYNNKPLKDYFIRIPYWIVKAYRLQNKLMRIKLEIYSAETIKPLPKRFKEINTNEYFKSNWSKKITKMRKLNNNYIKFIK